MGDRASYCRQAIDLMDRLPGSRITARAHYYLSAPVGVTGQEWYLNTAVSLETDHSPQELLENLLEIELLLGRVRVKRWDARTIDLDLLLFGQEIINSDNLTVPHPLMHRRRFVLEPMRDISAGTRHPVLKKTIAELLDELQDDGHQIYPVRE